MRSMASYCASACGNCAVALAANPLWLVKNRMQLEEAAITTRRGVASPSDGIKPRRVYGSVMGGLAHAVRTDGVKSLWRGSSAQLLVGLPSAATFPVYEFLKARASAAEVGQSASARSTPMSVVCLCSVVAKVVSTFLCHPLVLVKVRLQDPKRSADALVRYETLLGAVGTIYRREGATGFYRGIWPSLVQIVPRSVAQILLYEIFVEFLRAGPVMTVAR